MRTGISRLEIVKLPKPDIYLPKKGYSHAIGYYINYLELQNLIIVPAFGLKEDAEALEIMTAVCGKKVVSVDCTEVALEGGVLNCVSWVSNSR